MLQKIVKSLCCQQKCWFGQVYKRFEPRRIRITSFWSLIRAVSKLIQVVWWGVKCWGETAHYTPNSNDSMSLKFRGLANFLSSASDEKCTVFQLSTDVKMRQFIALLPVLLSLVSQALGVSLFSVINFQNLECKGTETDGIIGTCLSSTECSDAGGSSLGNCAAGFGTCCYVR